jgi:DNA-binding transcriptional regulator YdaS (Cro superfamily)
MGVNRKITQSDREASANLKKLWKEKAHELGLTQQIAAERLERSPGLISQYMNAHTALGPVAVLKFARLLQCSPRDIRPDFSYGTLVPGEIPPDVIELAIKLSAVPEAVRRDVLGYVSVALANQGYIDFIVKLENGVAERA